MLWTLQNYCNYIFSWNIHLSITFVKPCSISESRTKWLNMTMFQLLWAWVQKQSTLPSFKVISCLAGHLYFFQLRIHDWFLIISISACNLSNACCYMYYWPILFHVLVLNLIIFVLHYLNWKFMNRYVCVILCSVRNPNLYLNINS